MYLGIVTDGNPGLLNWLFVEDLFGCESNDDDISSK